MGYSTDFFGRFQFDRPLEPEHVAYLKAFAETRRMKRQTDIAMKLPDPIRKATGLPVGAYGEYFVGGTGFMGQDKDASVIDSNYEPPSQPGLWCQWVPTSDGRFLEWDGHEKFYSYIQWLKYIITHFLVRWGYTLNGTVAWEGEERDDTGTITVSNNQVLWVSL